MAVAGHQRKLSARTAQDVLLDHLQIIAAHLRHNGHVAKLCVRENNQVVRTGLVRRAVAKLHQSAPLIACALGQLFVEETLGVAHPVGHPMLFGLVIEPFHEFYALPFLAEVIAVGRIMFAVAVEEEQAVVIDGHALVTVPHTADLL